MTQRGQILKSHALAVLMARVMPDLAPLQSRTLVSRLCKAEINGADQVGQPGQHHFGVKPQAE